MGGAFRTGQRRGALRGIAWALAVGVGAAGSVTAADRASAPPARPSGLELAAAVAPDAPNRAVLPAERAAAQPLPPAEAVPKGPVTGLPMPRFVSLRAGEGNARRGPALSHRVDWVFTRRDMPLRVTAESGHWRRVEDAEGAGGWMHFALLSGARTALVLEEMTAMHLQPDPRAPVVAWLEAGVIARVLSCEDNWCRLRADRLRGWAPRAALWGVGPDERIE
jgi:SH3-like domain-containing protein